MSLDMSAATPEQLIELLRWYGEMGVDAVLDETPHNRFVEQARAPEPPHTATTASQPASRTPVAHAPARPNHAPAASSPPRTALLPADAMVETARESAAGARTLDELRAALERFDGCGLKRTATQLVFADGTPGARVMLVGEAPGADEDRTGRPFVGRGGQLLDRMLAAIGLDRTGVYIANVVPWRPPGNRTPTPQEVALCYPFITRQIALAAPDVLVLLGAAATQALQASKEGIMKARGKWLDLPVEGRVLRAMPMLHPAYLLRQPAHKGWAWRDLRALRLYLDSTPPPSQQ